MRSDKNHKKELQPKAKDFIGDTMHHAKPVNNKEKYKHQNHWIEEEFSDEPIMKAKKPKVKK